MRYCDLSFECLVLNSLSFVEGILFFFFIFGSVLVLVPVSLSLESMNELLTAAEWFDRLEVL